MKQMVLGPLVLVMMLSGCGVHYHRIEGEYVVLGLRKPEARQVVLACSLDGFLFHDASGISGRWEITLPADREFRYFYRVDGKLFIPPCAMKEIDDMGSESCIYEPEM